MSIVNNDLLVNAIELIERDVTVVVIVGLSVDVLDLFVRDVLTELLHDLAELVNGDLAVLIFVEDLEGLNDEVVLVLFHLLNHHFEFVVLDNAVAVLIYLYKYINELVLRRVLTHLPKYAPQLFHVDLAVVILIKHIKDLFHLLFSYVAFQHKHKVIVLRAHL